MIAGPTTGMRDLSSNLQQSRLISPAGNPTAKQTSLTAAGNVSGSKRGMGNTEHRQVRLRIADGNCFICRQSNELQQLLQASALVSFLGNDGRVQTGVMSAKAVNAQFAQEVLHEDRRKRSCSAIVIRNRSQRVLVIIIK